MTQARNAFPKSGGIVNGNVDATGYVKSGDTADVVSGQDMWAKRHIYESGLRVYSPNHKPTAGDVGAYPKSGGIVNGNVDATGYISGKGVYEASGIRVYSSINKPSPGELGAYTTGECDRRYGSKNTANKAANGWWKCGDTGIMQQWNRLKWSAGQSLDFKFPTPFPNAVLAIMVTAAEGYAMLGTTNRSKTGFTLTGNAGYIDCFYLAIGY
ncbi:hypothetical protein BDD30_0692 [Photorhabdus asymbiotica]|uniref:Putative tail fiber protein gp53-like C-terminal domain-containing protein n=1 Tax=Photorhabdus asymbiotica TaxID=291112 RepID=A0ABX9SSJ1_9GAMM|nr:hypothetical protein [Photorhabdus asymbiotica]RKS66396.1 hypothetical protein BDD30_0692 [Photorhabdus asymbiotica]